MSRPLVRGVGRIARWLRRLPLALEAATSLAIASLAVRLVSRSRLTGLLGIPIEPSHEPQGPPDADARRVARAITRVAAALPWHPTCLPQAIATRWMLRRRGIGCETHLGIVSTAPFSAHAWVSVRGVVVQGGPVPHITEIATLR
jgi:Transglutaminase-like superfamily